MKRKNSAMSACNGSATRSLEGPVAWWKFDGPTAGVSASGVTNAIEGNCRFMPEGVCGDYLLKRVQPGGNLNVELAGSPDSPVFNPALVIQGWGESEAASKIDGTEVPRGRHFRYGHRRTLDGTDLVVWIKTASEKPVRIAVSAAD